MAVTPVDLAAPTTLRRRDSTATVVWRFVRKKPLGAAGGVLMLIMLVTALLANVLETHDPIATNAGATLAKPSDDNVAIGFRLRDTLSTHGGVSRGLCIVDDGYLNGIRELHDVREEGGRARSEEIPDLTGDEPVSVNLWGFRPSFCDVLRVEFDRFRQRVGDDPKAEFLIGDAIEALPNHGTARVRVVPTPERFLGVTYQDDVAGVRGEPARLVDEGVYPSPLWA